MSIVKFGSIVTSGSGSLGGSTIQPFRSTHVLRKKPLPPHSSTPAQRLIRSYNKTMQAGWQSLTDQDRSLWNNYAKEKPVFNRSGEKHPLSGHSLWMKYQYQRLAESLPFLSDPSLHLDTYLGPELLPGLDFYNWVPRGYVVIDTPLSFHSPNMSGVTKLILSDAGYYRLTANILSLAGRYYYVDDNPARYRLFPLSLGYSQTDFIRVNAVSSYLYIRSYFTGLNEATFEFLSVKKIYNY